MIARNDRSVCRKTRHWYESFYVNGSCKKNKKKTRFFKSTKLGRSCEGITNFLYPNTTVRVFSVMLQVKKMFN